MPWVRSGYCCQCGECCRGEDPFGGTLGPPPVPGFCALYRLVDGHGHCSGHEPPNVHPYYLGGCNRWPDRPELIANYPQCTYRFEWRDDGG